MGGAGPVNMTADVPSDFGNYMLAGKIQEVVLPESVGWWPLAPAWYVLVGVGVLVLLTGAWRALRLYSRNRYRREILAELERLRRECAKDPSSLTRLPVLLKAAALHVFPRSRVAALSGDGWISFIEERSESSRFTPDIGRQILSVSYKPYADWHLSNADIDQLFDWAALWIASLESTGADG